jgi:hypothetical protein
MQSRRPSAVTTVAVLNLILGSAGLMMTLMAALIYLINLNAPAPTAAPFPGGLPVGMMDDYLDRQLPTRHAMTFLSHGLSVVGFVILIISGVGMLHLCRWAWGLAVVYVVWNLLHSIFFVWYHFGMVLPAMGDFIGQQAGGAGGMMYLFPFTSQRFFYQLSSAFAIVPGAYPILLLCLLFLPSVTTAFRPASDLPQVGWGPENEREQARRDRREEDRRRYDDEDEEEHERPPPRRPRRDDDDRRHWTPKQW